VYEIPSFGHVASTRTAKKIVDADRKTIHYKIKYLIIHEEWKRIQCKNQFQILKWHKFYRYN
jgi:hypothetical protein